MIKLKIDTQELQRLIKEGNARFLEIVRNQWQRSGLEFIGVIVRRQMTGRPGLNVVEGALRRSWHPVTSVQNKDVKSLVLTDSKYARIHQYGGVIKPVRKKLLYIPLTRAGRFNHHYGSNPRTEGLIRGVDFVLAKQVRIPKRLHVLEEFKTGAGIKLYTEGLVKALRVFKKENK